MRHNKMKYQFNRRTTWRKATIKSIVRSLFLYESIKTTNIKAQAVEPVVAKLISWAKENTLAKKRMAFSILGDHALVSLLFNEIGPRFSKRSSGFTRILKIGNRRGDNAEMVLFELIEKKEPVAKDKAAKETHEQSAVEKGAESKEKKSRGKAAKKAAPAPEAESQGTDEKGEFEDNKPNKKFLGGIRKIFKKERDSL